MRTQTPLPYRRALLATAAVTAGSGLAQLAAPGTVLRHLRAENTPTARQGFATVGMFMVVVGGITATALRGDSTTNPIPVLAWSALQKLGAATAVTIGVRREIFGRTALLVAAHDALVGAGTLAWCANARTTRRRP